MINAETKAKIKCLKNRVDVTIKEIDEMIATMKAKIAEQDTKIASLKEQKKSKEYELKNLDKTVDSFMESFKQKYPDIK